MKHKLRIFTSMFVVAGLLAACSSDDDNGPITPEPDNEMIELEGNLETQTLTKDNQYLLKGQVFVRDGQELSIEPGTIIFGDKASKGTLIIDRGGKIFAEGTPNEPIVMTSSLPPGSRDRGDWGGLVILGRAPVNQPDPEIEGISPAVVFGGNNPNDNSGILRYLRVEFAGIELTPNNETNSITLGGVGNGTVMEYAQVSFGGDDGFEWFGGNVDGKYLISFGTWDDDFDVDYGYSGKNQYGIAVRYASYADQSGSNGFECDNGPNDDMTDFLTTGIFSNFTILGPRLESDQSISSNYQHAIDLRRRVAVTLANSVFVGFPRGIRMNQLSVQDNYTNNAGILTNNILVAPTQTYISGQGEASDVQALWEANNETITDDNFGSVYSSLGLSSNSFFGNNVITNYPSNPNFQVTSGTLTGGASFDDPRLSNSFFDVVSYRGAFGANDWTDGWAEFNPVGIEY